MFHSSSLPRFVVSTPVYRIFSKISDLIKLIVRYLLVAISLVSTAVISAGGSSNATTHAVTYDHYSLSIDGKRTFIYSGEFHPFRLPSPDLWLDVFEKMKAAGFNTITCYFDWDYHSPSPAVYDFRGVRNMDKFLDAASIAGLYVIVRPGPYINAETDSGGFPGWLTTIKGLARSTAADYLAASDQWLSQIDAIIARHQLTDGKGTVIACQVENEYYNSSAAGQQYMQHLEDKLRADGITVPLTGNHNSTFVTGLGATDIAGFDNYPQGFDASNPLVWNGVPDYYEGVHQSLPPDKPLFLSEFQGGSFDPWGGAGTANLYTLTGPDFENVFYKSLIAQGVTMLNLYMTYGGTNWGWLPEPGVYTSYDYGAAINEQRQLTGKYTEQKLIASFTQAVAPLAKTQAFTTDTPTNSVLRLVGRANPDDQTEILMLRHSDGTSTTTEQTHIAINLSPSFGYTYDDTASAFVYSGNWSHVANQGYTGGDFDNTESFSNTSGDSVSIAFTGSTIRWIAPKAANHGIAAVYLDGTLVANVDTYNSSSQFQFVAYQAIGLATGSHTLKIVVTGTKNPAASGTFVSIDAIDLTVPSPTGYYPSVPQQANTAITVNGRDAKLLLANYKFGSQYLIYSTSQLMTNGTSGDADYALLYDNQGNDGETVLRYNSEPNVTILEGSVTSSFDATRGDLRLNYKHNGLARVLISSGGKDLYLFLADASTAGQFWNPGTPDDPILLRGPYLVRSAWQFGPVVVASGDTDKATNPRVLFPPTAKEVAWIGVPGPAPKVTLPPLTNWKFQFDTPERNPGFDDSGWTVADHSTTNNPNTPGSLPVLYEDDYGFHHGNVWFRGHFTATGSETGIMLDGEGGDHGIYSIWLNGGLLGTSPSGSTSFTFPAGLLQPGKDNTIAVLVMNVGHDEDYSPNDSYKSPRGIRTAIVQGATARISWKIQGSRGGENLVDPVRGPMNMGGLYGERQGWFLPGFPDNRWSAISTPDRWETRKLPAGIGWYRTKFNLQLPPFSDVPINLQIADDPSRHYRAFIFLNGWMMGIYINDLGPQHLFSLPTGILNPNGENELAVAVWGEDDLSGGLGNVSLVASGSYWGGVPVRQVDSPGWSPQKWGEPSAPGNLLVDVTSDRQLVSSGKTISIVSNVTNASDSVARQVAVTLNAPSGWTLGQSATTTIPTLNPRQSISISWTVQVPQNIVPGTYQLAVTAVYQSGGSVSNSTAGTTTLRVAFPSLSSVFDNIGVTSNSNPNPSNGFFGFDGIGTTYSAEGLAAAGITPGGTIVSEGMQFTWPNIGPALPDNVLANGQAILLPGKGGQLGFVAASNNAPVSGTGAVYYSDGTSVPFTVSVGNFWYASGQNGNPANTQIASVNYANYPTGSSGHTIYLFSLFTPIDPTKTVQAVILPRVTGSVQGSAAAMHIFSISIE